MTAPARGPTRAELAIALPAIALGAYALAFHLRDAVRVFVAAAEAVRAVLS